MSTISPVAIIAIINLATGLHCKLLRLQCDPWQHGASKHLFAAKWSVRSPCCIALRGIALSRITDLTGACRQCPLMCMARNLTKSRMIYDPYVIQTRTSK